MDQEEKHKAKVKNMLAGMFPWETRDPDRDILVEECKEAIMKLSHDKNVFFGPYAMPRSSIKLDDEEDEEEEEEESNEDDDETNETSQDPRIGDYVSGEKGVRQPLPEQLERLATLEPLPPLLQDFEIENHVGLIQKMLKEDLNLSKMHSKYGVGESEHIFWRYA
jgi:TATA-binding protein-associated factor Taf7